MIALSLEQPLWLVASVTALVVLALVGRRRAGLAGQGRLHRWLQVPVTGRQRLARAVWPGQLLALFLVGLGLARPLDREVDPRDEQQGLDITLVLDRSSSMDREDPVSGRTRLDAARQVLDQFIASRAQDRLALVTFARDPRLVCPATLDHELLRAWVREIEAVDPASDEDRTALGVALARVAGLVRPATTRVPVVVLLTDGENNVSTITPAEGAMLCRRAGLRLYAIGMTGVGGADPEALARLAESTGGRGFAAANEAELRSVYREIARLEADRLPAPPRARNRDRSRWFLVPGAFLFLLLFLLDRSWLARVP